jgi:electron transport complex protein RnfC
LICCNANAGSLSEFLDRAIDSGVDTLIANVMENMPLVTADHRLLAEHGSDVVGGLAILAKALSVKETMLAVDGRRTSAYKLAARLSRSLQIQTIALAPKYPIGAEAILVKVLTRRQVVPGQDAMSARVGVVDAATCHAIYQWAALERRQLARVVTVSGLSVNRPANCLVPFGADATALLRQASDVEPVLAVHGSPMNGRQLVSGAVVGPTTNALLAMEDSYAGPSTPCIRCSWCSDSCPARLNVAVLNDDFELANLDGAKGRKVTACVGCGICSYVCPARLPLMLRCQQLKRLIQREQAAKAVAAP